MTVFIAGDGSASRVRGLAVAWDKSAVYYVKLASGGSQELWTLLKSVLETAGPEKITYNLKHQLAAVIPTGMANPEH